MPAKKTRRPAGRGRAKGKSTGRGFGPLLVVGLLLFVGGVYFGGRIKNHSGKPLPPPAASRTPAKPARAKPASAARGASDGDGKAAPASSSAVASAGVRDTPLATG